MLQFLIDNWSTLFLGACLIASAFTGKNLTPDKIELRKVKREQKRSQKLIKKGAKLSSKLESISDELQGGEK